VSDTAWILSAGFAALLVTGVPFAIALLLTVAAVLLVADIEPVLGEYWPGDSVRVRITDYRFPAGSEGEPGLDTTCRLLGHTTKIDDADLESVDLILSEPLT